MSGEIKVASIDDRFNQFLPVVNSSVQKNDSTYFTLESVAIALKIDKVKLEEYVVANFNDVEYNKADKLITLHGLYRATNISNTDQADLFRRFTYSLVDNVQKYGYVTIQKALSELDKQKLTVNQMLALERIKSQQTAYDYELQLRMMSNEIDELKRERSLQLQQSQQLYLQCTDLNSEGGIAANTIAYFKTMYWNKLYVYGKVEDFSESTFHLSVNLLKQDLVHVMYLHPDDLRHMLTRTDRHKITITLAELRALEDEYLHKRISDYLKATNQRIDKDYSDKLYDI